MSKKFIKICAIVFVVCLLVGIGDGIYRYQIRKITDVERYLSKDYVKYNYGEAAEQFFDEYTSSEDYKNIAFYYCDAEKIISPYNTWTIFVLDIHYEENEFDSVNDKLISKINKKDPDSTRGGFLVYKIENEDAIYQKNSAFILLDEERYTIRYLLVCDRKNSDPLNFHICVERIFPEIKWNSDGVASENDDWIFDYSHINRT